MTTWNIHNGDCRELARSLPKESYHAILCDPPYHLGPQGFMGKAWDKDGPDAVAFNPDTWKALAECLLPGGFGMAFASSRGWHRLAVAIEDAGLQIHPTIFCWSFGSGFPKATNISIAVDKAAGAEREVIGTASNGRGRANIKNAEAGYRPNPYSEGEDFEVTVAATPLAQAWEGHRYGLQAMKPAIEPIIVFQKPYRGKPLDCITQTGAGALNIDGCRINIGESTVRQSNADTNGEGWGMGRQEHVNGSNSGRWPANFVLDQEAAARLDAQSGTLQSGVMRAGQPRNCDGGYHGNFPDTCTETDTYGDSGGASRFFYNITGKLEAADPVYYCAKASRSERNAGCETFEKKPLLWSSGTQNPGSYQAEGTDRSAHNNHPTVKPLDLCRWLATLLLPPPMYGPRKLLVPFSGSGSEMIGGLLAGWDEITGLELTEEYIPIAKARLEHWNRINTIDNLAAIEAASQTDMFSFFA